MSFLNELTGWFVFSIMVEMDLVNKRALALGFVVLGFLVAVLLGYRYLVVSQKGSLLGFSRLEVVSEIPGYEIKVNNGEMLVVHAKALGLFDREFVLAGAEFAPYTVPRDELRGNVKRMKVVLGRGTDYPLNASIDVEHIPQVGAGVSLADSGSTLVVKIDVHPASVAEGVYSDEELSIVVNQWIMGYLADLTQGVSEANIQLRYQRYLDENKELATRRQLPLEIKRVE